MPITIPKGKQIQINRGGSPYPGLENANMILEEDVPLSLASNYDFVMGGTGSNALLTIFSQELQNSGYNVSGQYKQFGMKYWQKTEPITLSLNINLRMRYNAKAEVVDPALVLMKIPIPGEVNGQLTIPGPRILGALSDNDGEKSDFLTLRVGGIRLPGIIIEKAQPSFSSETDENGYPIFARIQLDISTLYTATKQMIDNFWTEGSVN